MILIVCLSIADQKISGMEVSSSHRSDDGGELMDWEAIPAAAAPPASEVARVAGREEQIGGPLHVYVKRVTRSKTAQHRRTYQPTVCVVDRVGGTVQLKAWGKTDANWMTAELRLGRWYAIQHVTFDYRPQQAGEGRRGEHFRVRKNVATIRELTAAETMAETTTESQPSRLLAALAGDGACAMLGQFYAVGPGWEQYICKRCKSQKAAGPEAAAVFCPRCGDQRAGQYDWGVRCGVKGPQGNVENFVLSSRQSWCLLEPDVVRDPNIRPVEKLDFLIGESVGVVYYDRRRPGGKRRMDDCLLYTSDAADE